MPMVVQYATIRDSFIPDDAILQLVNVYNITKNHYLKLLKLIKLSFALIAFMYLTN